MGKVQDFLKNINLKRDQYHTVLDYLKIDWHKTRFVPTDQQFDQVRKIVQEHGTGFVLAKWIKEQNSLEKYGVTSPNKLKEKREKSSKILKEKIAQGIRFGGNVKGCNSLSVEERQKRRQELKQVSKERWGENYPDLSTGEKIAITCKKRDSHKNQHQKYKESVLKQNPGYVYFNDYSDDRYFRYYLQTIGKLTDCKSTRQGTLVLKKELESLDLETLYKQFNEDKPVKGKSKYEDSIEEFLKELNFNPMRNTRKILEGKELDLYIPEKSVAIEFNGHYWHSDEFLENDYHLQKTVKCQEKNIRLIQFFEDEWVEKQEICKSIVRGSLIPVESIYARDCTVEQLDNKIGRKFVDNNHLQSSISGGKYWGLYFKNELVQVIQLGQSRFKKDEIELLRMCTKLNTRVIGGFSKLLKHQPYNEIYSFIDRRLYDGKGYTKVGWQELYKTKPSYFYVKKGIRESRFKYQKHKLKNLLEVFDENKSESENMYMNGYHRIYDCGTIKMIWKRS